MSAFVVSKRHILYLIQAATCPKFTYFSPLRWWFRFALGANELERELPPRDHERSAEVTNMLWMENTRSVSHLYGGESSASLPGKKEDRSPITAFDIRHTLFPMIDPVHVLACIDCYEYQSCEHPTWWESEAAAFCRSLKNTAVHNLKGYDDSYGLPPGECEDAAKLKIYKIGKTGRLEPVSQ